MRNGTQRHLACFSLGLQGNGILYSSPSIGELQVGLAWDIRVIPFYKQIDPNIS
jgi:hypothetical protein